jgi:hypothetical protein
VEGFGILCSIPFGFVMSMVYCAILSHAIVRYETLRRSFYFASLAILFGFSCEVLLLTTLGAVRSRAFVGPAFYVAHIIFFFLGTPALANVLLLRRPRPLIPRWYLAAVLCTIFAFALVILQYDVSEALYGIDGTDGPYS